MAGSRSARYPNDGLSVKPSKEKRGNTAVLSGTLWRKRTLREALTFPHPCQVYGLLAFRRRQHIFPRSP